MKRLSIRVLGSKHPPFKLQIHPGTRSCDVLAHLNLRDYVLSLASDPQRHFTNEEELYGQIANDEKLIAKFSTEKADTYIRSFFK